MKPLTIDDPETRSTDVGAENIEQLNRNGNQSCLLLLNEWNRAGKKQDLLRHAGVVKSM